MWILLKCRQRKILCIQNTKEHRWTHTLHTLTLCKHSNSLRSRPMVHYSLPHNSTISPSKQQFYQFTTCSSPWGRPSCTQLFNTAKVVLSFHGSVSDLVRWLAGPPLQESQADAEFLVLDNLKKQKSTHRYLCRHQAGIQWLDEQEFPTIPMQPRLSSLAYFTSSHHFQPLFQPR